MGTRYRRDHRGADASKDVRISLKRGRPDAVRGDIWNGPRRAGPGQVLWSQPQTE